MPPTRTSSDPDGYYLCLGLEPSATRAEIVAAFRGKARILHPDVPKTGNARAFLAVRQAYDVLSNPLQRAAYDRRAAAAQGVEAEAIVPPPFEAMSSVVERPRPLGTLERSWLLGLPLIPGLALAGFLCLCVYQAVAHLLAVPRPADEAPRPNAGRPAIVAPPSRIPLQASVRQVLVHTPTPERLAGTANFYVLPAASPAIVWLAKPAQKDLTPLRQLPPFSTVQAIPPIDQGGMVKVLMDDHADGFISADHLTPGDAAAARRAYCTYNAGPAPADGELLERRGQGNRRLELENRAVQPAVVKLRDTNDTVVLSVFLGPGAHARFDGIADGTYRPEFATGELWSRTCNAFAVGMRAQRVEAALTLPGDTRFVVAPDAGDAGAADISDLEFERN